MPGERRSTDAFTTLGAGETSAATVFRCPLCGGRFTHGGRSCGACPLESGCGMLACPHCSYSFPRGSRLLDWLRGLRGRDGRSA